MLLSPMAVPFVYTAFVLHFFPACLSLPCSTVRCGNIDIRYPFYTNASPTECRGKFLMDCDFSTPVIQFTGVNYNVRNISYHDKVITIQDPALNSFFFNKHCSFLCNFTTPIPNFNVSSPRPVLYSGNPFRCTDDDYRSFIDLFHTAYNYSLCRDYRLYYWNGSEYPSGQEHPSNCLGTQPKLFEWNLSFREENESHSFSLLSAGFSRLLECFNCQLIGKNCSGSVTTVEHSCLHKEGGSSTNHVAIAVGLSVGGAFVVCSLALFLLKRRKRLQQSSSSSLLSQSISLKISSKKDPELLEDNYPTHIFSYQELEEATDCFDSSKELGDGGFGTVYKGKLRDGRTVAVKRLYENSYRRLEQFMNEIEILSNLRHQNLVTLYGCTSRHSRELLLVYEFISNGTLADHLHGSFASKGSLTWPIRMSIAIQTANALAYLHSVEPQIIHRDVKSTNILLDHNFNVKVADFGLSRLFPVDATHVSTAPQGTPGYVDPEYHQCYQLTSKSDVYSFGVVLVELISSKPAVDFSRHRNEINLSNLAITKIQNNQIDQLVDSELGYQSDLEITDMINQVAELIFRCLQLDREMRPCIKEVLEVLRGIETGGYKKEKGEDVSEVLTKEESQLLKNVSIFLPHSGSEVWFSLSTASDTSL